MLSKSFNLEDIVNKSPIDNNNTNIDNKALNLKLNSLPSPKLPDLKDPKNKHILDKLENLPAEKKFIGIKKSRKEILLNIKNKSGVYMFFNLFNGNTYVGSSVNLAKRFRTHMSSIGSVNLPLYNALNKYGPDSFAFIILQYCDKDEEVCLDLEQTYLDQYKPNYNILKLAGSSKGYKHSPETIANLQKMHTGKLHPRFGQDVSEEQKLLTSLALKKYYQEHDHHSKGKKGILSAQYGIGGTQIIMTSELGKIIKFPSINSARIHFRVRFTTISKNINNSIIIKGIKWNIATNKDYSDNPQAPGPPYLFNAFVFYLKLNKGQKDGLGY